MVNIFIFGMTIGMLISTVLLYFEMPAITQNKMITPILVILCCSLLNGYFCYRLHKKEGLL